ncbi:hypothetical protein LOKVESSMR4R_01801 [Yoonia vestfoldensis]|jgi:hypothetical protein|uniref:Uncharacterized protein n=1 Tax=Yoonia vestfoldensis TaxID=245188 RepID=A0A1Y0EBW3_9RHOB|nr:hypothetical protein LOKVESSMR4R_01801 [Yoonia vestfoldensis]
MSIGLLASVRVLMTGLNLGGIRSAALFAPRTGAVMMTGMT